MSIEIKIPSLFARYTSQQQVARVNGSTVGECLEDLVGQFPDLKKVLFTRDGRLHYYIDVRVNMESAYPEKLAKPVKKGDTIHLIPIISGG